VSAWGGRLISLAVLMLVCAISARAAWVWQANTYGKLLAEKDRAYSREREEAAAAALTQLAEQQDARRALEARLQDQTKTHWKELNDAQQAQARLRDRLATADLRLSVLVDAGAFASQGCDGGVREASSAGGVVHGAVRAQLDPAHAQRIVAITDEGDRGLIALQACQAYVREVTK
jgi:hypothetical protein